MVWYDPVFAFKKSIVIPHGNVSGASDLLDFPVLISVTDSKLAAMLNGGQVYSLIGYDLLFTDASETRELAYEIESYNNSTGTLLAWVRVPVLSANQDTVLYLYFGNSTVTGYQAVASNVWDKNYKAVYHLNEASGASTLVDSTGNALSLTKTDTTHPNATTGEIVGGESFDGSTAKSTSSSSALSITGDKTVEAWINAATFAADGGGFERRIIFKNIDGTNAFTLATWVGGPGLAWQVNDSGGSHIVSASTYSTSTWYHVVGTYTSSGSIVALYINGVSVSNGTQTSMGIASSGNFALGYRTDGNGYFQGSLDEVRVSNVARTASWVATEYTNQNNPSSFIIAGQTIPLVGNVDISALAALGVTTTQAGVDQINVAGRGANFAVNVALIGAGETLTLRVQGKDGATGQYYTIASFSGIGSGNSFFTVYPGLNASSAVVDAVLPRTWRVTMTPSTADTAAYTVGASLIR